MATTTISTTRSVNDGTVDLYDTPAAPVTVATGVRAVISAPTARADFSAGERVTVSATFRCDPCDIQTGDTLTDNTTGVAYEVLWARTRYELGVGYTFGGLQIVEGATAA